jgi:hypothetical protein
MTVEKSNPPSPITLRIDFARELAGLDGTARAGHVHPWRLWRLWRSVRSQLSLRDRGYSAYGFVAPGGLFRRTAFH